MEREDKVTVVIPSTMRSEKTVMKKVAAIDRDTGFSKDRVQDLKTAVSEAYINAIEHGNRFIESTVGCVTMRADESTLWMKSSSCLTLRTIGKSFYLTEPVTAVGFSKS